MKNTKKAFTIVECIIAMAIVSMVSALAVGIFMRVSAVTSNQWSEFRIVQFANNALKCFQGSDDMTTFAAQMKNLSVDNSLIDKSDTENMTFEADPYSEYDPGSTPIPTSFAAVRVYEDKSDNGSNKLSVAFFGHALNKDTAYSDPMASFSYTDASLFSSDKACFANTAIYNAGVQKNMQGGVVRFAYTLTGSDEGNNKSTYNFVYDYKDANGKDSDTLYVHITKGKTSVTYAATDFDKYLFNNRYILCPFNYDFFSNKGKYVECNVHSVNDSNKISKTSYKIKLTGTITKYSSAYKSWNSSTGASMTPSFTSSAKDTNMPTSAVTMDYYPWVLISVAENDNDTSEYDSTTPATASAASSARSAGGTLYTDYTIKSGVTSDFAYGMADSTSLKLYNSQGTVIYTYSATAGNTTAAAKTYTKVRAYSNGTVTFYNGNTPVYSYPYEDKANYNTDIKIITNSNTATSSGNSGSKEVRVNAGTVGEWIERDGSGNITLNEQRNPVTYRVYYYTDGTIKYTLNVYEDTTSNTSRAKKLFQNANDLEKYLLDRGMILYIDESSLDKANNTLYFYALDAATGQPKKNSLGKNMFIRVSFTPANTFASDARWNVTSTSNTCYMGFNVTGVACTYSSATNISALRSDSAAQYTAYGPQTFTTGSGIFAYAYNVSDRADQSGKISANHVYQLKAIAEVFNKYAYDEYTVSGTIAKTFITPADLVLANASNQTIYKNSEGGCVASEALSAAISALNGFGCNKSDSPTTGVMRYYKIPASGASLSAVRFYDSLRTIVFYSGSSAVYEFSGYASQTNYESDRYDITEASGPFHQYYDAPTTGRDSYGNYTQYTLKSEYLQPSVLRRSQSDITNSIFYQIVSKKTVDGSTVETPIFNAYITSTKYDSNFAEVSSGSKELSINYDVRYYTYNLGKHACLVRVQYSKYSEKSDSTLDLGVEPVIKIWMLTADELLIWSNTNAAADTPVDPATAPYIHYRKG